MKFKAQFFFPPSRPSGNEPLGAKPFPILSKRNCKKMWYERKLFLTTHPVLQDQPQWQLCQKKEQHSPLWTYRFMSISWAQMWLCTFQWYLCDFDSCLCLLSLGYTGTQIFFYKPKSFKENFTNYPNDSTISAQMCPPSGENNLNTV